MKLSPEQQAEQDHYLDNRPDPYAEGRKNAAYFFKMVGWFVLGSAILLVLGAIALTA